MSDLATEIEATASEIGFTQETAGDNNQILTEVKDWNLPPGWVKRVNTVVHKTGARAAGGHTAVTEVTWFEKTDPDGQFVMTKKWKRSSKRDQQRRLNIPATKEESLEQAKAAAKHGEYILAKAKGGYEGTVKAVDGVNTLLEQIGLEIQIFSKDGHDGIRLACEEGNDTGNDYQAGERLAVDQSVLNICEALASANVSDDYWSIDV